MVAPGNPDSDEKKATRGGAGGFRILHEFPPPQAGEGILVREREYSSVRLRLGVWGAIGLRPVAAFSHELVELGLVLGMPQAIEELAELALLLFESPQRLGAVLIEGMIATGARSTPPLATARAHSSAHTIHLLLHTLHLAVPTVHTMVIPAAHSSAPNDEGQRRKAQGPPETKPEDRESDPGGPS